MSAPAPHPTARARPVALDRLERQRGAHVQAALFLAALAVYSRIDGVGVAFQAALVGVLGAGLVLPTLQAIDVEKEPAWDAAMPMDRALHARVRLACGAAWAAFLLAAMAGLYAVLFGDPAHPWWYPLALLSWGLTVHLLMSAGILCAGTPRRFLVYPVLWLVSIALLLAAFVEPAELGRAGVAELLARTALLLALAGAAAYVSVRLPARLPEQSGRAARRAEPRRAEPRRAEPRPVEAGPVEAPCAEAPRREPAAPGPVRRSGPGGPAPTLTVFRQHFALLRRRAVLPAVVLPVFAVFALLAVLGGRPFPAVAESMALGQWCVAAALSWTVLVWLDEHGRQRRWNDALPVGTGWRRVLHAAAGAAWLLLFVLALMAPPLVGAAAAGTLASPAGLPAWLWLGLPCRTLTLYLAATFAFFGARLAFQLSPYVAACAAVLAQRLRAAPRLAPIVMAAVAVAVPYAFIAQGALLLEGQAADMAEAAGPQGWSGAASALRLVLYAAAAGVTIALNDWIHRLDRLPTVREVRGLVVRSPQPVPSHASTRSRP